MMRANQEKITPRPHHERHAYVYVRQSSPSRSSIIKRVSAPNMGWSSAPWRSAGHRRDARHRCRPGSVRARWPAQGFQELVAEVSLGRVGIILAYEASRLARSNADWYALLDLATLVGTLLADAEGVYDPRDYNDRLLWGCAVCSARLNCMCCSCAWRRDAPQQIERGAYRQRLPTGLERLPDRRVVKDPDLQVQSTMALLIITHFATLGSCQKVLRRLRDDGTLLPRRQTGGPDAGALLWKPPSRGGDLHYLHNPAYAGAFAYGRRGAVPERLPGKPARQRRRDIAAWTALHRDTYAAYISWEEYVANQERLADNAARYVGDNRGAAREGAGLLVGLVVCGKCGRQMHVEYKTHHHYVCSALADGIGCLNLPVPGRSQRGCRGGRRLFRGGAAGRVGTARGSPGRVAC